VTCLNLAVHVAFAATFSPTAPISLLPLSSLLLFPLYCLFSPYCPFLPSYPFFSYCTIWFYSLLCSYGPFCPYSHGGRPRCGRRGGGGRCMFLSLCPCFALALWVRLGAGGEGRARGGLGRGCNTPGQEVLENHKRRFCFLQRIHLVWTCTTALQLASRMAPPQKMGTPLIRCTMTPLKYPPERGTMCTKRTNADRSGGPVSACKDISCPSRERGGGIAVDGHAGAPLP